MSSSATLKLPSYRKLRQDDENGSVDDDYYDFEKERVVVTKHQRSVSSIMSWYRLKSKLAVPGTVRKRRLRLRKRVVSLRRLLLLRRKLKLAYGCLRASCQKVVKRFKDGQSHFGDMFAGNYMFLQVNPSSLKCVDHRRGSLAGAGGEQKHPHQIIQSFPFPSRTGMGYTFPRN